MFRGTTPTLIFNLSINANLLDSFYITFVQNNKIILEKTKEDTKTTPTSILCELTQEETLKFSASGEIQIQIRGKIGDKAVTHKVIKTSAHEILKRGVI